VVEKVFNGTPLSLVRQLLTTVSMTDDELSELRRLIREKEKGL